MYHGGINKPDFECKPKNEFEKRTWSWNVNGKGSKQIRWTSNVDWKWILKNKLNFKCKLKVM